MKYLFSNISISKLILIFLSILAFVNVTGGGLFLLLNDDSVVVDLSGRNRMLSQRIVLYASIYTDGNLEVKQTLQDLVTLHDNSVKVMKEGGQAPNMTKGKIVDAPSLESKKYLEKVDAEWLPFKQQAYVILNNPVFVDSTYKITEAIEKSSFDNQVFIERINTLKVKNPKVVRALSYLIAHADSLLKINNDLVVSYVGQNKRKARLAVGILIIGIILSLIIFLIEYLLIKRFVSNPLREIVAVAHLIAKGDYTRYIQIRGRNELGLVADSLNKVFDKFNIANAFVKTLGKDGQNVNSDQLNKIEQYRDDPFIHTLLEVQQSLKISAEQDKRRNWINEGLAKFGDASRNNSDDIKINCQNMLSFIIEYVEATVGAILVAEEENQQTVLNLMACYAYGRKKFVKGKVLPGEGITGQVWQEGKTRLITEASENHFNILTSLGESKPNHILIIPLNFNQQVFGVLELATLNTFEEYKLNFIEEVSTMIAANISYAISSEETKGLLLNSQRQTEKLRAQEEELRQNMEELQATQEAMRRKQVELEEINKRLQIG